MGLPLVEKSVRFGILRIHLALACGFMLSIILMYHVRNRLILSFICTFTKLKLYDLYRNYERSQCEISVVLR